MTVYKSNFEIREPDGVFRECLSAGCQNRVVWKKWYDSYHGTATAITFCDSCWDSFRNTAKAEGIPSWNVFLAARDVVKGFSAGNHGVGFIVNRRMLRYINFYSLPLYRRLHKYANPWLQRIIEFFWSELRPKLFIKPLSFIKSLRDHLKLPSNPYPLSSVMSRIASPESTLLIPWITETDEAGNEKRVPSPMPDFRNRYEAVSYTPEFQEEIDELFTNTVFDDLDVNDVWQKFNPCFGLSTNLAPELNEYSMLAYEHAKAGFDMLPEVKAEKIKQHQAENGGWSDWGDTILWSDHYTFIKQETDRCLNDMQSYFREHPDYEVMENGFILQKFRWPESKSQYLTECDIPIRHANPMPLISSVEGYNPYVAICETYIPVWRIQTTIWPYSNVWRDVPGWFWVLVSCLTAIAITGLVTQ